MVFLLQNFSGGILDRVTGCVVSADSRTGKLLELRGQAQHSGCFLMSPLPGLDIIYDRRIRKITISITSNNITFYKKIISSIELIAAAPFVIELLIAIKVMFQLRHSFHSSHVITHTSVH